INTGVVISPELQQLIFNQFDLSLQNNLRTNTDSGLGLTLVKRLTETLNGTVNLESNEQATIFTLKFPLEPN
ncbi:MAG: ATP-binding protein, partial [Cyanobacteria bacterium J06638_38]